MLREYTLIDGSPVPDSPDLADFSADTCTDHPIPSQLSQRLRAMHAARRLHCSTPDTHQPVYSIQATAERLADLMAAADRLEQLQRALDEADLREMGAQSAACHLGALVDEITAERDALEQQLEAQTVPQAQHLPADDTEGGAL